MNYRNTKYAALFLFAGALFVLYAALYGGYSWALVWPGVSFALVGLGYGWLGPGVFGKRPTGGLSPVNVTVLLPYLVYLWTVWHAVRLLQREDPYNELLPDVLIGRRLLAAEVPAQVDVVLDLACEFAAPASLRGTERYRGFPILDASIPPAEQLRALVESLRDLDATLYIHCAQGHGRTGLVAATLLLARGAAATAEEAIGHVRRCRPKVRLSGCQRALLERIAGMLTDGSDPQEQPPTRQEPSEDGRGRAGES